MATGITSILPIHSTYMVDNPRFPFCKGCGHTSVLRRLNEALVELQIPPHRLALVTDIGCIGLADGLFKELHTVHTTHGRSTAFATGIALADSVLDTGSLKTVVLIGDGGAMIGLQHLVHAAMLNIDVTVLICNNFVYGMTGGQGSSVTPECFVTATTPYGNIVPPVDLCAILQASHAPFVARILATDPSFPEVLQQAIAFKGFSVIEVLELCTEFAVPSNKLDGRKLRDIAGRNGWSLGLLTDRKDRTEFAERWNEKEKDRHQGPVPRDEILRPAGKVAQLKHAVSVVLAGSAGERIQSSAGLVCAAAVASGLHISQKNDNPVTQGSGFSASELWWSPEEIGFTGIQRPDIVLVTSADGLRDVQSRSIPERLGSSSAMYIDDSLPVPETGGKLHRLPFRRVFGLKEAALGALVFAVMRHHVMSREILQSVLQERYRGNVDELFAKVDRLQETGMEVRA